MTLLWYPYSKEVKRSENPRSNRRIQPTPQRAYSPHQRKQKAGQSRRDDRRNERSFYAARRSSLYKQMEPSRIRT